MRTPRRLLTALSAVAVLAAGAIASGGPAVAVSNTHSFGCEDGDSRYLVVPENVDRMTVSAGGGSGATGEDGRSRYGKGALVEGTWSVTPGATVRIVVGCAASGRDGGLGYANGGRGGGSGSENDGGGGGGSTFVGVQTNGIWQPLVVAGGGGGGGGSGYGNTGGHGTDGGPGTEADFDHWEAEDGWRSSGGGGGGGAGAGAPDLARPGKPGRGGGYYGDWGGAGKGGTDFIHRQGATGVKEVRGGAPAGSGFVLVTFLAEGGLVPLTTSFPCANGEKQQYTVPADVHQVELIAVGGAGSNNFQLGRGGSGARVTGELEVTPGLRLQVVAGCQGVKSVGGAGWGSGGDGGEAPSSVANLNGWGGGGGGASAVLDATGGALIVAAGGGGVGGTVGTKASNGGDGGFYGGTGQSGDGSGGHGGARDDHNGSDGSNGIVGAAGGGGGGGWRAGQGGNAGGALRDGGGGGGGSSWAAPTILNPGFHDGGGGNSNGYVIIVAITATVPGNVLNPAIVAGDGAATVRWDAPLTDGHATITEYVVTDRSTGRSFSFAEPGSYTIAGLVNGRETTLDIVAVNDVGPSNPVAVTTTPRTIPNAPSGVFAMFERTAVRLEFGPPAFNGGAPVTGYTVYELTTGLSWSGTGSPIRATGLTPGVEYAFQVAAVNAAGEGARSAVVTETPRWMPDRPTITTVYGAPGAAEVLFSLGDAWGSPILSATVTATPVGGGPVRTAIGNPHGPITVNGLTDGVEYLFTMTVANAVGASLPSAPYGPVAPSSSPSPPLDVVGSPGDGAITLTWDPPLDLYGYDIVEYQVFDVYGNMIGVTPDARTTYTVPGLTNGESYSFGVRARSTAGIGAMSVYSAPVSPIARPVNDPMDNPTVLPWAGVLGSITGTTLNATVQPDEEYPGDGHTVWYWLSVQSETGGAVILDLCDSATGVTMTVNGSPAFQTEYACPGGGEAPRYITDFPAGGIDLLIQVDSTGEQGEFTLRWRPWE